MSEEFLFHFKRMVSGHKTDPQSMYSGLIEGVAVAHPEDNSSEFTGDEEFDVLIHLNTTDMQDAKEIVSDAGEAIADNDNWDNKLEFETDLHGGSEFDMEVFVYLMPESRKIARGTTLHF